MSGVILVNTNVLKLVHLDVIKLVNTSDLILVNVIVVKLASIDTVYTIFFECGGNGINDQWRRVKCC